MTGRDQLMPIFAQGSDEALAPHEAGDENRPAIARGPGDARIARGDAHDVGPFLVVRRRYDALEQPARIIRRLEMIGRVLERVLPELLGDLEILRRHRFDLVIVIETEADAFLGMDAAADAVENFALGEMIEEVHLLDQMHRMMQRHNHHRHAEPRLLQLRRDIRRDLERRATLGE